MKIVITGANGFVGAALCRYFADKGHEVIATGRQFAPHPKLLEYATYIPTDITQPIAPFEADACIHAAGLASDTASYNELNSNNVTGTKNVFEAAKQCSRFVFISSSSVYNFNTMSATEKDAGPVDKLCNYGKTKLLAEELAGSNIPVGQQRLILRPRAIYGIGDRILLPRILKLLRWGTFFCPVDSRTLTSATHIDNLVQGTELFLNQQNAEPLQTFNIADDQAYALKDMFAQTISAVQNRQIGSVNVPFNLFRLLTKNQLSPVALKALTDTCLLDITSIQKKLGYAPSRTFDNSYHEIGEWINALGGKKQYLKNLDTVPWMIN